MLFVVEKIVKRLTWLILLAFPALVLAQDVPEPAGSAEVVPTTAVDEASQESGAAPQEAGDEAGDEAGQPDGKEGEGGEKNLEDLIGLLCCCGFWSVIPIVLLIIFLVRRANAKKRTETLSGVAAELNLEFSPVGEESLKVQLGQFPLLNKGRKGQLTNVCVGGTDEVELRIFDYRYITGYGRNRRVHRQTVVAMQSALLNLPEFRMRPERMFDRVGQMLGLQDIDFEEHLAFSQQFVLQSDMAEQTREFFDNALLDFFAARSGWSFETRSGSFIVYRPRKLVEPAEFKSVFEDGFGCFTALRERLERS